MEAMSRAKFNGLELSDFVEDSAQIGVLRDWEFMDDDWVGQAIGFTQFLKLKNEPDKTRSISISLDELPDHVIEKILEELHLPLSKGGTIEEVKEHFGEPIRVQSFSNDRKTYELLIGKLNRYYLSCTVHHERGLIYLVMMDHEKAIKELESHMTNC